jgi:hypothetical protein
MASSSAADWAYVPDAQSGAYYYANLATGETTWERPAVLDTPGASSSSTAAPKSRTKSTRRGSVKKEAGKWVEFMDETQGLPYYYNEATGESVWVLPASDDEDEDMDGEAPVEDSEEVKAAEKRAKRAEHRVRVLGEIVSTEQSYVDSLHTLKKVYLDPLRMVADSPKGAIFSHADLDAIFLNVDTISKVNDKFLEELERAGKERTAEAFKGFAKKFRGCYTRYVNNFDEAEAKLKKIRESSAAADKEKQRYLKGTTSHPDAKGRDVTAFLIMPVQRVLRYRLLLEDLIKHTEEEDPGLPAIKEAYESVCELARGFNEDKRSAEDFEALKRVFTRFVDSDAVSLQKSLLSYERKLIKEGSLVKVRLSHRQRRTLFLFSDILIYGAPNLKGDIVLKGQIKLHDGARVESLPTTEEMPHAIAIIDTKGKGYTWICESDEEKGGWFRAIDEAIKGREGGQASARHSGVSGLLAALPVKSDEDRLSVIRAGGTLTKYNKADGKSKLRWVYVGRSPQGDKIFWGDQKTRECKSDARLSDATALMHGAKSQNFFKQQGSKKDQDWQCFSIVFKERTLDFAATNVEQLLDWYLALAALIPHSTEPLHDEPTLRKRLEQMGFGSATMTHYR